MVGFGLLVLLDQCWYPAHLWPHITALQCCSDRSVSVSAPLAAGRSSPRCCWGTAAERSEGADFQRAHLNISTHSLHFMHWKTNSHVMKKEDDCLVYYLDSTKQVVYSLSRQATRGSAVSLESRYTSCGCSLAGVIAKWRQSLLMYWTNATSISKLHFLQAFWAWRVSIHVHLVQSTATVKKGSPIIFSFLD